MSAHPLAGDPLQIEEFLAGRLGADVERQIELHLETCSACRSRLETAAADESYWSLVPTFLADDEFDSDLSLSNIATSHSPAWSSSDDKPELLRITDYLDPTDDPRMLGRFGGYEIAGVVGSGGMGVVLKGFEVALDRYVAIKVLAPHLATSGAARSRFAREARAAAAVLHENVVSIHRVAEASGLPFLVMPYIPGDSLIKRLDQRGRLELREVLRIGMQVAAGLAAAHAQGLVHRDIKPGNILLDCGVERVTITDFGLARAADDASLTRSGAITGTPQYMSPEQARGEPVDARSDLFSLGSVLYVMCTGRAPFRAETAYGVLRRICESDPRPIQELAPEMPAWLSEVVQKLHAKNLADRFQSAAEVSELLGQWLCHVEQPTAISAPARLEGPGRGRRWTNSPIRLWQMAALAGIVPLAVLVVAGLPGTRTAENSSTGEQTTSTLSVRAAEPSSFEPLIDEQTMYQDYRDLRARISRFQRDWSASPPAPSTWEAEIPELRQQLENLFRQIDQGIP